MDVLGLEDKPSGEQSVVYEEFLEQLSRSPEAQRVGTKLGFLERGPPSVAL